MKKKHSIILAVIAIIIAFSAYVAVAGLGADKYGSAGKIKLGLDLEGGLSITYATVNENPSKAELDDTKYKLQLRLDDYGYTEGEVYLEGNNRINVDIPGVENAQQVLVDMGKPGKLVFTDEAGKVIIAGADIKDAQPGEDTQGKKRNSFVVKLTLNDEGAAKFAQGTKDNMGKRIPIIYNDTLLMAPTVQAVISDGVAVITNISSYEEASKLASNIRIGALPLELKELRSNVVGAKLGQKAIDTSVKAGLIGIIIIFLFMIIMYRVPGVVASLSLLFYASITIIILSVFGITLTLPGIAGIILSIGMAVDANVIIFSRIMEEIAMEKTLKASVKAGFTKATSAILDGNATTLIAAIVLYFLGTGTIKGFAITLILGILVSMFTALVLTRIILNSVVAVGMKDKRFYGVDRHKFKINVIDRRKIWFIISGVIIVIGLVMMPVNNSRTGSPLNYDIEFSGGTSTLVSLNAGQGFSGPEDLQDAVKDLVVEATGDKTPQFQNVAGKDEFIIKTSSLDAQQRLALGNALIEKFGITESAIQSESISATISGEMRRDAILAVILAAFCILIYITFRFHDFWFGFAAVIALIHDILIVLAVYSIGSVPINNSFIAAMLTIVGYSINDTIVIFDRIRENQGLSRKYSNKQLVDMSISQTLTRSINTSLTTIIMIVSLYILGVASIREFALPLMAGVLSGTYSSIFIASPLWFIIRNKLDNKKAKK